MEFDADIILLAGPTASGKTAAAIELASQVDATIINTDSMQVYDALRIISARPSQEEEAQANHQMFGHVPASQNYSVAAWLNDVKNVLGRELANQRKIIFAGGTGLYFNALVNGISPIPDVNEVLRRKWREIAAETPDKLHEFLMEKDPQMAKRLEKGDTQRILRALEVFDETGKSLLFWQSQKGESLLPADCQVRKLVLMPERSVLHERINARFDRMIDDGGIDEVRRLQAMELPKELPAMKAIGVPQICAFLNGDETIETAIEQAKAATRQYAKRQSTWFRNSFDEDWKMLR